MWTAIATTSAGHRGPRSRQWLSQDVPDRSLTAWEWLVHGSGSGLPGGG